MPRTKEGQDEMNNALDLTSSQEFTCQPFHSQGSIRYYFKQVLDTIQGQLGNMNFISIPAHGISCMGQIFVIK